MSESCIYKAHHTFIFFHSFIGSQEEEFLSAFLSPRGDVLFLFLLKSCSIKVHSYCFKISSTSCTCILRTFVFITYSGHMCPVPDDEAMMGLRSITGDFARGILN